LEPIGSITAFGAKKLMVEPIQRAQSPQLDRENLQMGALSRRDSRLPSVFLEDGRESAESEAAKEQGGRVLSYKPILVCSDVLNVALAAAVAVWVAGDGSYAGLSPVQKAFFYGVCFIVIGFFPSFNLYSYHRIFSPRYHLLSMAKAFGLSLLALGAILVTDNWSAFLPSRWLVPALLALAVIIFVFSRIYGEGMIEVLKAVGFACIAVGLADLIASPGDLFILECWKQILVAGAFAVPGLFITRYLLAHVGFSGVFRKHFRRQVLVVGSDQEAEKVTEHIIRLNAPFWVAGTVDPYGDREIHTSVRKKALGRLEDLEAILGKNGIHEVIVTDGRIEKSDLIALIDPLIERGISVWFLPRLMPIIDIKLYIDDFCGMPMIRLGANRSPWIFNRFKVLYDLVFSLAGLVLLSPVMAVAAAAIKLDSAGPVFYRPQVVGKHGRLFSMFKFRSMITGAGHRLHRQYVTSLIKGEIKKEKEDQPLKITNDPRITRVGGILRRTSMDELPQLINVIKGDMSLVGPRPCLTYEYEIYKDWHKKRTMVKPGITGLWQVVGRSEVTFEDMILLDLYYISNRSIELDFNILIETVFVVLKKKGAL